MTDTNTANQAGRKNRTSDENIFRAGVDTLRAGRIYMCRSEEETNWTNEEAKRQWNKKLKEERVAGKRAMMEELRKAKKEAKKAEQEQIRNLKVNN